MNTRLGSYTMWCPVRQLFRPRERSNLKIKTAASKIWKLGKLTFQLFMADLHESLNLNCLILKSERSHEFVIRTPTPTQNPGLKRNYVGEKCWVNQSAFRSGIPVVRLLKNKFINTGPIVLDGRSL